MGAVALQTETWPALGEAVIPEPWSGFGRFLMSLPMRHAVQAIEPINTTFRRSRQEWLYRPPAGMSPSLVFGALETDPDLHNVELSIVENGLKYAEYGGPLSINLSPAALGRPGFGPRLVDMVRNSGINPADIWWEVTETWPVPNPAATGSALSDLQTTGGKIAIDDIASIERLEQWLEIFGAPDIVKIDKSVVQDGVESLNRLVNLATCYNCEVVVEGVETHDHLALAIASGAHYWQGFLGGHPEMVEE